MLHLGPDWLAVKEAAFPGVIGLAILISAYTLIRTLLYNPRVLNIEKIEMKLHEHGNRQHFDRRILNATYLLSSPFLFSAFMNYMLAKWIVTSPAGTSAFNEELGRMTLLSYPVSAIP